MLSIRELNQQVFALEERARRLESDSAVKDDLLSRLRVSCTPFSEWIALEKQALLLTDSSSTTTSSSDSEVVELARLMAQAEYEKVVYESDTAKRLFSPRSTDALSLKERAEREIETGELGAHRVMFVGAALLQLYVQANWTGPPVASLSDPARYPLGHLPRESELEGGEELIARLEKEAKATSAATGKDRTVTDLDQFPRLHALCAAELECNGEPIVENSRGMHYLSVARNLLKIANETSRDRPLTSAWWRARSATVHQESLQSREVAFDLREEAEKYFERCYQTLQQFSQFNPSEEVEMLGMFFLERGVSAHKFKEPNKAKQLFAEALGHLKLKVELSGALGKRTKFQMEEKSQLVLLADSSRTQAPEDAKRVSVEPATEGETAGFGTVMEAGHVRVRIEEVDEDTPLHERIQITPTDSESFEKQRRGHLAEIDQVAVLDLCIDVKNSYAMERLTAEEMLAYCERVTENPDNWSIHGCALLIKSKLEFERWKTKERSVLQMQMLVDQQSNRLTPLQFRQKDIVEDSAKPLERLQFLHSLVWPPVWRLKRSLADRYAELGVQMSALNIYQELRLWEDAVTCLVRMDKRNRAETLIRERLEIAPTPNLYVALGDLIGDESLLEKAWEVSHHRYARAKRLLGTKAYDRGDFEGAKRHLSEALEVNPQFPWAWFRLGAAAMRTEDWHLGKRAYARVVSLEPEDAEAWGNLSGCLVKLNEIQPAFHAIQEASKHGFGNARIWDSLLTLSLKANEWDSALLAMDTLIDLEGRKAGAPKVDIRALLPLTEHAIKQPSFRIRFEGLIAKIKAKCQSQADVWALVSEYYTAVGKKDEKRDALIRRCRALMKEPEWFKDFVTVSRVVLTVAVLCAVSLDSEDKQVHRETVAFVNSFIGKVEGWKQLPNEDLQKRDSVEEKMDRIKMMMKQLTE